MKKDKRKSDEPFNPERTPSPPQVMDPNNRGDRDPNKDKTQPGGQDKKPSEKQELLNEKADIQDETTI